MKIGVMPEATRNLGAPANWDHSVPCDSLPVRDVMTEIGNVMVSAWIPSNAELGRLLDGKPVLLYVYGNSHPPVMIEVGE